MTRTSSRPSSTSISARFGKGFEPYIERAQKEHGVRYMRCMVSSVKEVPGTHNLRLSYVTYEGRM